MNNLKVFLLSSVMIIALGVAALAQESAPAEQVALEAINLDENIQPEDLGISEPTILPDSSFYFLKSWGRGIQSFFTFNPVAKSELKEKFANEKLMELKKMVEQNKKPELIKRASDNYQKGIEEIKKTTETIKQKAKENPEVDKFLNKFISQQTLHQKLLQKLEEQVPTETFEKIKENRERHLEGFQSVMLKLEDRKEVITEKLDKILEEQKGSEFKEFKNLEVLKNLEEKVPEQAKEAIQKAQENTLKRLQGDLEKMSSGNQEKFKGYIEKISGAKEKHLEILEDIKAGIKRMPTATGTLQFREKLDEGKLGILEKISEEARQIGCPAWSKPVTFDFCKGGRIVFGPDIQGCPEQPLCIILGDTPIGDGAGEASAGAVPPSKAPGGPLDTALAEITILSVQDKTAEIRIENIRDYNRLTGATYSQLKVGDEISVGFSYVAPETPTGSESQAVKKGEPPSITIQPKPIVGKKYLASMTLCIPEYFGGLSCKEGWSAVIYPITPPPIEPITPPATGIIPPSTGVAPAACITLWDPVCGKDGKTYSNKCFAGLAGVEIEYGGICKEPSGIKPPEPEPIFCAQVITPAISPDGTCKEFPTPCDVPEGWKKVNKCPE